MNDHTKHLVQWVSGEAMQYRLYCFTCGRLTQYATQSPNHTNSQRFEQAMNRPEKVSVTLEVQSLRHKRRTQEM